MDSSYTDYGNGPDRKKIIIIAAAALVIIILLFLLLSSCGKGNVAEGIGIRYSTLQDPNARAGSLSAEDMEAIMAELNRAAEEGMMTISMNLCPVFETGASEGNLLICNDRSNRYPQIVEIYLKDTSELIYSSGSIPVGSSIENARLSRDLDAGIYRCTAYFLAINPDSGELMGKAGADITVTVSS